MAKRRRRNQPPEGEALIGAVVEEFTELLLGRNKAARALGKFASKLARYEVRKRLPAPPPPQQVIDKPKPKEIQVSENTFYIPPKKKKDG